MLDFGVPFAGKENWNGCISLAEQECANPKPATIISIIGRWCIFHLHGMDAGDNCDDEQNNSDGLMTTITMM